MSEAYKLTLNDLEGYKFSNILLNPGKIVELLIDGLWLKGHVERWNQNYYWFSEKDQVAVSLHAGLSVRFS